ncbi:MAG TPA: hypothetical protein VHN77_15320 [Phycisphaerales bacterium]|nr:hypothetical protein [Phycisphaerales bacterium]
MSRHNSPAVNRPWVRDAVLLSAPAAFFVIVILLVSGVTPKEHWWLLGPSALALCASVVASGRRLGDPMLLWGRAEATTEGASVDAGAATAVSVNRKRAA